jgi:DNA-binding CsgD family transcriptional regulator
LRDDKTGTSRAGNDLDVTRALEELSVPACVVNRDGKVRWQNRGGISLFGNLVGQSYTRTIAPEDLHRARTHFAKKVIGEEESTDYTLTLLTNEGRQIATVSSVPLWDGGEIIGVFGIAYPSAAGGLTLQAPDSAPELTARQHQALALLAEGLGTAELAKRLGIAEETARNHIRGLLRQLDAHSRLEAVVKAYRLGLLQHPRGE